MLEAEAAPFKLMPPAGHVCDECAVQHLTDEPHDAKSLFYQYHFYFREGRWPTWADALAHVPGPARRRWETELRSRGEVI